jgi:hypothetical protein
VNTYRSSSLPLLIGCPGAQQEPKVRIRTENPQALVGTVVHSVLRGLVEEGVVDWAALPGVCKAHGASQHQDEVAALARAGERMWPAIRGWFSGLGEQELGLEHKDMRLTGHVDGIRVEFPSLRIADWKSGRLDHSYRWQLQAYNALGLSTFQEIEDSTATAIWLRDGEIENYTMHRGELESWLETVHRRLVEWDGTLYPSEDRCLYCPRAHECEAHTALVRRSAAAVTTAGTLPEALAELPPNDLIALRRQAALVISRAEEFLKAARFHVIRCGDVVGDQTTLTVQRANRRELDPFLAWPVLEKDFDFEDKHFAECVDLPITRVEDAVKAMHPKGKKAAALRRLREALDTVNAVNYSETARVVERRNGG